MPKSSNELIDDIVALANKIMAEEPLISNTQWINTVYGQSIQGHQGPTGSQGSIGIVGVQGVQGTPMGNMSGPIGAQGYQGYYNPGDAPVIYPSDPDTNRATGRTTRQIQNAINVAKVGPAKVYYISKTWQMARMHFEKCIEQIMNDEISLGKTLIHRCFNNLMQIELKNGAFITFVPESDDLRGISLDAIIFADHTVGTQDTPDAIPTVTKKLSRLDNIDD